MIWPRSIPTILSDWQGMLDYAVEAGDIPLFDFGQSHNTIDGLQGLAALEQLADESLRPTLQLTLAAGGASPLWLTLLVDAHALAETHRMTAAFTGVDPATHMASLSTHVLPGGRSISWAPKVATSGLPVAVRSLTFPQLEPAAISPWQALPLTMSIQRPLARFPQPELSRAQPTVQHAPDSPTAEPKSSNSETDWWLVGSALIMCCLLLLIVLVG